MHLYWPKQTTYVKNLQERSTNEEQEVVVIVEIKKETSACNVQNQYTSNHATVLKTTGTLKINKNNYKTLETIYQCRTLRTPWQPRRNTRIRNHKMYYLYDLYDQINTCMKLS